MLYSTQHAFTTAAIGRDVQYGKFIAAEPTDDSAFSGHLVQYLRRPFQQTISGVMSRRVVDILQVIDIDVDQQRAVELARSHLEKPRAIVQKTSSVA
jgi:hypothetical protein